MSHNRLKTKKLPDYNYAALVEKRRAGQIERANAAVATREALLAQLRHVRGEAAEIDAATGYLIDSAVSATVQIAVTTRQFLAGRASAKAMLRLGNARSELRRCLRSLGLVADSGEAGTNGANAPPPGAPTDESMRAVVARFGGAPKEVARGASESD